MFIHLLLRIRTLCMMAVGLILLHTGCQQDTLVQRLAEIRMQITDSVKVPNDVLLQVRELRSEVFSRNHGDIDGIYNVIVMKILEQEYNLDSGGREAQRLLYMSRWFRNTQSDPGETYAANIQRQQGHHDRSRSIRIHRYTITDRSDVSDPDLLANLGLEMYRIGLYRHAQYNAEQAYKGFRGIAHLGGQLFAARVLCASTLRLGDTLRAIKTLGEIRLICDSLDKRPYDHDYVVTKLSLLHTLRGLPNYTTLASIAFPTTLRNLEQSYRDAAWSALAPWEVGTLSKRTTRADLLPLPIIRSHAADITSSWWISAYNVAPDGQLVARTTFGAFIRMADRWFVHPNVPALSTSKVPSPPISIADTIHAFSAPVNHILPVGPDSYVVITSDSMVRITAQGVSVRAPQTVPALSTSPLSALQQGSRALVIASDDAVFEYDPSTLNLVHKSVMHAIPENGLSTSDIRPDVNTAPILISLDPATILILTSKGPFTYDLKNHQPKPVSMAYRTITPSARTVYAHIPKRGYLQSLMLEQTADKSAVSYTLGSVQQSQNAPLIEPYNRAPNQVHCAPGLLGIRYIDDIDIIDTVQRRVYAAASVPFPVIRPNGSLNHWTIVRGTDGHPECLVPYGRAILRYRLQNFVSFNNITPYVVEERTREYHPERVDTTTNVLHLRHGERFLVGFHQPLVTSTSTVGMRSATPDLQSMPPQKQHRSYLQILGSDAIDGSVITHPFTKLQWRISVTRPFFDIPLVQPFAYALSTVSVLALVVVSYRARKRRLATLSESIRQEQLALLREDMHDMIGSKLVRIASLTRQGASGRGEDVLERIHEMTTTTIQSLRNMLSLMSEEGIADEDFFGMMREYVVGACADVNITCAVSIDVPPATKSLTNLGRHELLMIITEMVTNSMRHAACSTTRLAVKHAPDHWSVRWSDNGKGLDRRSRRGHGLNNIERRSTRLGATVSINPVDPSGTEFHIVIPIKA